MKIIVRLCLAVALFSSFFCLPPCAEAFWIWTPESGKWVNPKNSVKSSPQEQLAYADELFQAGKHAEAMREYKKLLKQYPKAREAAEAQFQLGRVWEEMQKYHQAVEAYQKVIERYPFSDLGPKVVERQYVIANLFIEGKARDSHFATSLLGNEYNIVEIFRKVIKNDPYGPYAAASQYKIGLFYLEKKEFQQARDEFEKTMNDYPDSKWAESAKYQVAVADSSRSVRAQYDQKVTNLAAQGFQEFVKTNPESELTDAARQEIQKLRLKEAENAFLVAEFYAKQKKLPAARIYFMGVADKYGDTIWGEKAKGRVKDIDNGSYKK